LKKIIRQSWPVAGFSPPDGGPATSGSFRLPLLYEHLQGFKVNEQETANLSKDFRMQVQVMPLIEGCGGKG
jgi:hypothetical protein